MYSKLWEWNSGYIFLIVPIAKFRQLIVTLTLTVGITTPMVPNTLTLTENATNIAYEQYNKYLIKLCLPIPYCILKL